MNQQSQNDISVIIPAAGYGIRSGRPQAKEMLIDPETGQPLIDRSLAIARALGAKAVVVTRKEKTNLIDYIRGFKDLICEIVLFEPTKEWPHTVLQSKPYWSQKNLLLLPDTVWSPADLPEQILESLTPKNPLNFAALEVESIRTWGAIKGHQLCEKFDSDEKGLAWGLIGFDPSVGEDLFSIIGESSVDHQWKKLFCAYQILKLDSFKDLTRSI